MPTLRTASADPASIDADAVVVGVHPDGDRPVLAAGSAPIDAAVGGRLAAALAAAGATGRPDEVTRVATLGALRAPSVVAVGLGPAAGPGDRVEALRRATGAAVRTLAGSRRVVLALPAGSAEEVAAVCEGALLGAYRFDRYRSVADPAHRAPVAALTVATDLPRPAVRAATARAEALAEAVGLVRDLVNTPPGDLHPAELAAAARSAAEGTAVTVEVLDERALRRGGYGGLLGVGAGSAHPPRLVRLGWRPPRATGTLALIGKGITFDSGGLSLKPAAAMEGMKSDMAGAAAVLGSVLCAARLGLPLAVTGWLACAENMPSGSAIRPSDVLTLRGGKTVEVLNTDAEGRLVLGDALVRAGEEEPDWLVDVATLTGAQLVALGSRTAAVMANDEPLRDAVVAAARDAGELVWPMPLPEELRRSLDSEVADIANMGDRYGGMLVAGLFLREFVPAGRPWAHLDIAGPAFNSDKPHGYTPAGGTGFAVRTLVRLAEDLAARGNGAQATGGRRAASGRRRTADAEPAAPAAGGRRRGTRRTG